MQKPRRRRGERPGWVARYVITVEGRRIERSAGVFSSERDAQAAINRAVADHQIGSWVDPQDSRTLIKDWANSWYALRRSPSKKVRSILDARIIPYWGETALGDVRTMQVQQWVNLLAMELSPETVRNYYAVLKQLFAKAEDYAMIVRSPCRLDASDLPRKVESTKRRISAQESAALLELAPARYRALIHLALASGLRVGELLTLRWSDVDLAGASVTVRAEVAKSRKSRVVWISGEAAAVLTAHRRDFGGHDEVFTTVRGKALTYGNLRQSIWEPLVEQAMPGQRITFHCLRHEYASAMIDAGVDILVVSKLLGHAKPSFTLDVYGHTSPSAEAHVRRIIEEAK